MKAALSPEQDATILARYLSGERVQDLADEYGVSTPTIYNRIPPEQRRARGGGPRREPASPPARAKVDEDLVKQANPATDITVNAKAVVSAFKGAQITYRDSRFGYIPALCGKPDCGTDHTDPDGHLPIEVMDCRGRDSLRFCSWHCLSRHAIRAELAGGDTP